MAIGGPGVIREQWPKSFVAIALLATLAGVASADCGDTCRSSFNACLKSGTASPDKCELLYKNCMAGCRANR
jgi:hypothetical protein